MGTSPDPAPGILELARAHQLDLDPDSLALNEAGLDYRVATARGRDGAAWVLRVPRRPDVASKIDDEAAILALVKERLSVAVPDWRIRTAELIAYPLLPGEPGLTIAPSGELRWRLDVESSRYAAELGALLAELHRIDIDDARAAGIPVETPSEVRARWRADVAAVAAAFDVSPALLERWTAWLADDSYWPTWSVFTHGEIYPAHVLIDAEDRITGVLDWTTAKVGDPARDFAFQQAMTSPATFAQTVESYRAGGGRVPPRLGEHSAELMAASPVAYGVFALTTGDPQHRAAAAAQLDPRPA